MRCRPCRQKLRGTSRSAVVPCTEMIGQRTKGPTLGFHVPTLMVRPHVTHYFLMEIRSRIVVSVGQTTLFPQLNMHSDERPPGVDADHPEAAPGTEPQRQDPPAEAPKRVREEKVSQDEEVRRACVSESWRELMDAFCRQSEQRRICLQRGTSTFRSLWMNRASFSPSPSRCRTAHACFRYALSAALRNVDCSHLLAVGRLKSTN